MTTTTNSNWAKRDVKIIPSLIIGTGGTGVSVIRHLKRRVRLEWPGMFTGDMPDLIQFYGIDSVSYANRPNQEFLTPGEYSFIGGFDPQELINPQGPYRSVQNWWNFSPGMLPPGLIHLGARQIRPLGRLALFYAFPEVWQKIQFKIDVLNHISPGTQATRYGYDIPIETSSRQVFIVTSICGGTGAGCFLDIAARIRAEEKTNVKIIGIFTLPSAFEHSLLSRKQIDRTRANAYAAMKEIDAFWYGNQQQFSVLYPGESTLTTPQHAIFDEIYLIGRESRGRSLSTLEDVNHQIAHFLYLTSINNLAEPVGERLVNLDRTKQFYSSFAVGALSLPDRKLSDSLLADLKRRYLLNLAHDDRNVNQEEKLLDAIDAFIMSLRTIAESESINLIGEKPDGYNNHVRSFHEQLVFSTLRWVFGTIVPNFGLNAIPDIYREIKATCDDLTDQILDLQDDIDKAEQRLDRRGILERLGRFGQLLSSILRLKTADQYQEVIDNNKEQLAVLQLLVPDDDPRSGKRLLTFVIDILELLNRRVALFRPQAERLAGQLGNEQQAALTRSSYTPSQRGAGREYRYYDMELDPTLPGPSNAFESLVGSIISYEHLSSFITAQKVLAPTIAASVQPGVIPPKSIQMLGFYDLNEGVRRTGHMTLIGEVARLVNSNNSLNSIDREDWEVESMAEEFVRVVVEETLQTAAGLIQFFAQPISQNQVRRQEMMHGLKAMTKNMMDNVKPFWGVKPFPDENQLERIQYLCIAADPNANDVARELLREYTGPKHYQYIRGSDPYRLDALYIEHGARPQHVAELLLCKQAYEAFKKKNDHESLHLTGDYAVLPDPF